MRKIALFCLCGLTAASILTGCSGSADGNVNLGTVTLSEYKGVTVNIEAPEVTDEEVDTKVETILAQNPNEVEVDRAAKEGDIVNIDFKGTKDGEAFEGGSAEDQDLELGSGKMIEGFESGLIGAKKGETKTLNLTFPEDYREESLAGQPVVFEVTVNSVKEEQEAELNDDFVKRVSKEEYQTVDAYKESIREDLLDQKQSAAEQDMEEGALQSVISSSEFKLSRNGLSVRYNQMVKEYTNQAKMYGMSFSQMAQANGMNEPAMKEYIYDSVEEAAKAIMLERQQEFPYEGQRWFDLVRMGGAKEAMKAEGHIIQDYQFLYPIPKTELADAVWQCGRRPRSGPGRALS